MTCCHPPLNAKCMFTLLTYIPTVQTPIPYPMFFVQAQMTEVCEDNSVIVCCLVVLHVSNIYTPYNLPCQPASDNFSIARYTGEWTRSVHTHTQHVTNTGDLCMCTTCQWVRWGYTCKQSSILYYTATVLSWLYVDHLTLSATTLIHVDCHFYCCIATSTNIAIHRHPTETTSQYCRSPAACICYIMRTGTECRQSPSSLLTWG